MSLIPREEKYFALLNELVSQVRSGAELLTKLFEDFPHHLTYATQIKQVEKDCDKLTSTITDRLNSTFITPIDREDIYLLAKELDDIMDTINELARLTVIYNVQGSTPAAQELAHILKNGLVELEKTVATMGSRGGLKLHIASIKELEEQGDRISQSAIQNLFTTEQNPIDVIRWLKIYEDLENGIDLCWDVAKVIEAIAMKNA